MRDWLVRDFTVFGVAGQNWMLIAFAIILVSIVLPWWLHRQAVSVGGLTALRPHARKRKA
jgi:hypothetical protein